MSIVSFSELPDGATLWIFGISAPLSEGERALLGERMPMHLSQWAAHGRDVQAGWELRYDRFILIGINESVTGLTGCSQDSMRENIRQFAREINKEIILGSSHVFYRGGDGSIHSARRQEFKGLVETSLAGGDTPVFDNTIDTIGKLREGQWEKPLRDSWHARAFGAPEIAAK